MYELISLHSSPVSALMLLVGWQERPVKNLVKKLRCDACVVICLERGADLLIAQLMPLPLTVCCFSKIKMGLPFWYRLTRVVLDKGPLNGCVCVSVCTKTALRRGVSAVF